MSRAKRPKHTHAFETINQHVGKCHCGKIRCKHVWEFVSTTNVTGKHPHVAIRHECTRCASEYTKIELLCVFCSQMVKKHVRCRSCKIMIHPPNVDMLCECGKQHGTKADTHTPTCLDCYKRMMERKQTLLAS